jgi:pimeloyl-ACP methyl ester carboxylesterase
MLFEKNIKQMYRANLFVRQDNPYGIVYFSADDFPGLQAHAYTFPARAGHTLQGWFYHYENPIPGRLVIFDHGMGNGHRAYMTEIAHLAKAGYLVFSYDHTGCMASGGEHTNGFAQSLNDLDACVTALKAEPALADRTFSVMGHSWGGFSTMNIAALHPEITHVVSMSGFVSVEMIVDQTFGGPLRLFKGSILDLERQANPDFVDFNAAESLKNTDAKVQLIYSANDSVVHKNPHYDTLFSALKDRPNIRFRLEMGKDHSPNYTQDAVAYKTAFFNAFNEAVKKKKLTTPEEQDAFMARYDWRRMTAQDPSVWDAILTALK